MDKNHTLKTFFRLVQAHSEAQPYYPPLQNDQEVGSVFSDSRRIQIVWNAANGIFHDELVNLNITRMDDFNGDYETCKTKFLLAEQHFQTRQAKAKPSKTLVIKQARRRIRRVANMPMPTRTQTRTPIALVSPFVGTVVALIGGPIVSRTLTAPIIKAAPSPVMPPIPPEKARTAANLANAAEVNS